jgi:hypothetical protein
MRRFLIVLFALSAIYSCTNHFGLGDDNKFFNYITLDGKIFKDGDSTFYPMVMNYNIEVFAQSSDTNTIFYATPRKGYHPDYGNDEGETIEPWGTDSATNYLIIQSHLTMIKDMGFNSIRLTGLTTTDFFDNGFTTWSNIDLSNSPEGNKNIKTGIIPVLKSLIRCAEECDLRVILLLSAVETQPENQLNFYSKIADGLKKEKALMAYDVYNEPRYFDKGDYTKKQTKEFVESYNKAIKNKAPNHLTTIGLSHYKIMHEWDPELMDVDFLSFHIYPYGSINLSKLERFDAKLYWISKTITKPWIVGETGLNTDPECDPINWAVGTYADQLYFMSYSLKKFKASGSSGYSWWSFQDTRHKLQDTCEHTSFYGLVNVDKNGSCKNSKGDIIPGNLKHEISKLPFAKFVYSSPYGKDTITNLFNPTIYYNIDYLTEHNNALGRIFDEAGNPVENANITLFNKATGGLYSTFSKPDGSFDLKTGWSNVFKNLDLRIKIAAVKMENFEAPLKDIYKGEGNHLEDIVMVGFK